MTKNGIKFTIEVDNSNAIKRQLAENIPLALDAMGVAGVGMIVRTMEYGYSKRIRQTGDLQRDVQYAVNGNTLIIGNTLEYGIHVHEGTRKMGARPYIRDTLYNRSNGEKMGKVCSAYLSTGIKK